MAAYMRRIMAWMTARMWRGFNRRILDLSIMAIFLFAVWAYFSSPAPGQPKTMSRRPTASKMTTKIGSMYHEMIKDPPKAVQENYAPSTMQATIDYMAEHLDVKIQIKRASGGKNTDTEHLPHSIVTFHNQGTQAIKPGSWHIVFSHIYHLLPPKAFTVADGQFIVSAIEGDIFVMSPTQLFKGLDQSDKLTFALGRIDVESDIFSNWYLNGVGITPRIIISTAEENFKLDFSDLTEVSYSPQMRFRDNSDIPVSQSDKVSIIPTPLIVNIQKEVVECVWSNWTIMHSIETGNFAKYLSDKTGIPILQEEKSSHVIQVTIGSLKHERNAIESSKCKRTEAYKLLVYEKIKVITIIAEQPHGIFNGVQTLLSLMADSNGGYSTKILPGLNIVDAPRFSYRGLMLDVGRNFIPKAEILKVLDSMAMYKMNKLHLHLSDDQGWRIEIPGLEELTLVGSQRSHDITEKDALRPYFGAGPSGDTLGSGFYSVKDYKEILHYADARFIQIIPEIDLPGHSHAAVISMAARYRKYMTEGDVERAQEYLLSDLEDKSQYVAVNNYRNTTINPCMKSTMGFTFKVVSSIYDMHKEIQPLESFHLGGDEVPQKALTKSPQCDLMKRQHPEVRSTGDIKRKFITDAANLLNFTRLQFWEDGIYTTYKDKLVPFPSKKFPSKPTVHIWKKGEHQRAYDLVRQGYYVVLSEAESLYFDHPQEKHIQERGLHWAASHISTENVFKYRPMRDRKELQNWWNILGIECAVWGETIGTTDHLEGMLYPRMLAVAERSWHNASWEESNVELDKQADWGRFASILSQKELIRLERLGIKYYLPAPGVRVDRGKILTNTAFPGMPVQYSVNGSDAWMDVTGPSMTVPRGDIMFATRSYDGKRQSKIVHIKS